VDLFVTTINYHYSSVFLTGIFNVQIHMLNNLGKGIQEEKSQMFSFASQEYAAKLNSYEPK